MVVASLLAACSHYATVDGIPAYHHGLSDDGKGYTTPIEGVDAKTFRVLTGGYAVDRYSVYWSGNRIFEANAQSFKALSGAYGKDNAHVFYDGQPIPGVDLPTFELVSEVARDKDAIYDGMRRTPACDPKTYKVLKGPWHVDSQCVYIMGKKLAGADRSTFKVIDFEYGMDAAHVYLFEKPLPAADPSTFKIIGNMYEEDAVHVYYESRLVPKADPATFHPINAGSSEARDRDRCYRRGIEVDCSTLANGR
ncbi:hypothetical protein GCM10007898_07030 [Dyella flagellata]|uniref:DKNYY family protein n=2 Tax=Dyella flagellata TaxID=1867833 RepID=A0ABQ5X7K2_9GAMM|nr:hypothetical protein GCM10007898_07030 [Dyella flagellata]